MTRAYDRALLGRASDTLGRMLDFASRSLHHDVNTVMSLFCASGLAARFGSGDIRLIAGMSGIELAYAVLDRSGIAYERTVPRHTGGYSPEYWLGWALARAQWDSCLPFRTVTAYFPAQDFMADYTKKRTEYLAGLLKEILNRFRNLYPDHDMVFSLVNRESRLLAERFFTKEMRVNRILTAVSFGET